MAQRRKPRPQPPTSQQAYRDTEDALRELLQGAMAEGAGDTSDWTMGTGTGDAPFVGSPPGWGSYEPVGPGSDLAQIVRRLETIAPGIRGLSSNIGAGPDKGFMQSIFNQGSPEFLGSGRRPLADLTLRGQRGIESGDIYIAPSGRGHRLFGTATHELSHAGVGHPQANVVGALGEMLAGGLSAPPASLRRTSPKIQEAVLSQLDTLLGEKPWYRRRKQ